MIRVSMAGLPTPTLSFPQALLWRNSSARGQQLSCVVRSWVALAVLVMLMCERARGDAIAPQACEPQTSKSCKAMVGYMPSANFELAQLASVFSLANFSALLGPNDIDLSLPNISQLVLPPQPKPYLIPQTCGCLGDTRVVTTIKYTVIAGDTLSTIASDLYLNLVPYTAIANASGVPNPDLIQIGQVLTIPIPCSCFDNQSSTDISLSYQIQNGDSISKIAQLYNTTTAQLEALNGHANASDLEAGQLLFLPLPVCKANFSKVAVDANLTVVEGTYELTANGCVQCICNNGILNCIPAPSSFGERCANMTCSNSTLQLGASNTSLQASGECYVNTCVYKGFINESENILANLQVEKDNTCPVAPPPDTFYKPPTGLVTAPVGNPPPPAPTSTVPPPSTSTPQLAPPPNSAATLLVAIGFPAWWWYLLVPML